MHHDTSTLYEVLHSFGVMLPYLGISGLVYTLYLRRARALVASRQIPRTYALETLLVLAFVPLCSVHRAFLTFAGLPPDGLVGMYVLGVLVTASLLSVALLAWNFKKIDGGLASILAASAELEKSRNLIAGVLTSSRDGVMVFDAVRDERGTIIDFTFEVVNPAAEAVVGRSDLVGKRMLEELPGNKAEGLFDAYCQVVETGEPYSNAFFYDHDGITAYFENMAVRRGDGFTVWFRDVTEYKTAEHALRRSEARLRNITDLAPDAIVLADAEGRVIDWNQGAEALFGLTREEALGTPLERLMPERFREGHKSGMDRHHRTGEEHVIGTPVELIGLRQNGEEFPIELALSTWEADGEQFYTGVIRDITQRKADEAALHESQSRFQNAFQKAAIGKAIVERDGRFTQVNAAMCDFLGYTEEELLEKNVREITHPDDQEADASHLGQMIKGEIETFTREKRYLHREGHAVWGLLSVTKILDRDGNLQQFVAELQDIDQRKETEEAMRTNAERLQLLLQVTSDTSESLTTQIDQALALTTDVLGLDIGILSRIDDEVYTVENVYAPGTDLEPGQNFDLGHTYCSLTLASDDVVAIDHMGWSEYKGHPCYEAFGLETYIGIPVYVGGEVYGTLNFSSGAPTETPFSEEDRNFVRLLGLWVMHAIERRKTSTALRASEERFRNAFRGAAIGKALLSPEGRFFRVNEALCTLIGYTEENLLQLSLQEVTHPDHSDKGKAWMQQMIAGEIGTYAMEQRYLHRDGDPVWALTTVASVTDRDGTVQHFVAEVVDITARKEADRLKNEFVSMVSHELRTPLTSIAGSLRLIATQGEVPAPMLRLLDIASRNSDRLVRLINDLLDVQKIEAGKLKLEVQTRPLTVLLEDTIEANQSYGEARGVILCLRQAAPDVQVSVDADRFMQIMANLISNAIKYSPEQGTVEVSAVERWDRTVRIAVTDFGPGIPESFQQSLFDRFMQADSSTTREQEGTGLGLNITKSLVELHGGRLSFETKEGVGTTFYFDLPITALLPSETAVPDHSRVEDARPSLLVVEDDTDVSRVLDLILTRNGFRVDIAANAEEARALAAERVYAAATLDLRLPDADGITLLRDWNDEMPELPVVVLAVGASGRQEELVGGTVPVADWLDKPFQAHRLLETVQRIALSPSLPRLLHVEDDPDCVAVTSMTLSSVGEVVSVGTLAEAREALQHDRFDLAILDLGLPDGDGLDLLPDLKETGTPVAIYSARATDAETAQHTIDQIVKGPVDHARLLDVVCSTIEQKVPAPAGPLAVLSK